MTDTTGTTTTDLAVVTDVAPLIDWHTADGLAFATATRVRESARVRWAKRTVDAKAMERLRRG